MLILICAKLVICLINIVRRVLKDEATDVLASNGNISYNKNSRNIKINYIPITDFTLLWS